MDNKMTDKEIKKALECCVEGKCQLCPLYDNDTIADNCPTGVLRLCRDLINRKQAENENLNIELQAMRNAANSYKAEVERCKGVIKMLEENVKTAKSEAIKEFAERLKDMTILSTLNTIGAKMVEIADIDNLVKETVSDAVMCEMTCEDCLSEPSCSLTLKQIHQNYPEACSYFKNKADFAGVVLCKNCEFVHFNVESCTYHCKRRGYYSEEVKETDFCSNGKEKTTR